MERNGWRRNGWSEPSSRARTRQPLPWTCGYQLGLCPGGQKRANGGVLYAKFCLLQAYFCSLWRSSSAAACRRSRLLPNGRAILGWAGGRRCPCGLKPVASRLKLTAIKPRNLPLWPKPPVATPLNPRYLEVLVVQRAAFFLRSWASWDFATAEVAAPHAGAALVAAGSRVSCDR